MSHAWFYGAPVTKAVVFSTCASSMYALRLASRPDDFIGSMGLNASRVLASGELWRLVTCHLPFASTSELLLGLSFLYEMRKFERMMGSGKFGAFVLFVTSLAASLQAAASRTFESLRAPSTGPIRSSSPSSCSTTPSFRPSSPGSGASSASTLATRRPSTSWPCR